VNPGARPGTTASWRRSSLLSAAAPEVEEEWSAPDGWRGTVRITHGKPMDIRRLKARVLADPNRVVSEIAASRRTQYAVSLVALESCPACGEALVEVEPYVEIYGASYERCLRCQHVFVRSQPSSEAVSTFYADDIAYAATYTDRASARHRLEEVALPKARWALDVYLSVHERVPNRILDVGAGGGHFVRACRDLGHVADGIELSASSRRFAADAFDVELADADITTSMQLGDAELVTMWGVIEHVPQPVELLRAARRAIGPKGMVVVAVPRWTSLSSAVQSAFPESVVRHMDPGGHLHLFSDNSLLVMASRVGLRPRHAWYYGMDAYELVMQAALRSRDGDASDGFAGCIEPVQAQIDVAHLSDEIAVALVPAADP
jgi:2-polyprenyl-3-methyl-5-hydroxy-6-metoxy-1,4-benzoquinol methylase